MGTQLMAIVAEGRSVAESTSRRPTESGTHLRQSQPTWKPDVDLLPRALAFDVAKLWACLRYGPISFHSRQLVALTSFQRPGRRGARADRRDAVAAGLPDDDNALDASGRGAVAYADAVAYTLQLPL